MPIAGAFVVNFNVKLTSVCGGHSVVNNTDYEILLLLKATFFLPETFLYCSDLHLVGSTTTGLLF
jgi:hypothetical protein